MYLPELFLFTVLLYRFLFEKGLLIVSILMPETNKWKYKNTDAWSDNITHINNIFEENHFRSNLLRGYFDDLMCRIGNWTFYVYF